MTVIDDGQVATLAARIVDARRSGRMLAPLSDELSFGMDDAYRIQAAVTEVRLAAGERPVGWKLGYTTRAMREQMGVDDPNYGPLTDAMVLDSAATVPPGLLQPKVEPEIGFRVERELGPRPRRDDVLAAASPFAALEVVDSVWEGYRFRVEDNTADGSSAALVVVGPALGADRLDEVRVELHHNGEPCGSGFGVAAMGHPADAVAWLAGQLAERGRSLRPGDIVITGGLTAAVAFEPGDLVEAFFEDARVLVRVAVRR